MSRWLSGKLRFGPDVLPPAIAKLELADPHVDVIFAESSTAGVEDKTRSVRLWVEQGGIQVDVGPVDLDELLDFAQGEG